MSWTLYLTNVNGDEVDDALDGSEPSGNVDDKQYDAAKEATLLLAGQVDDAGAGLSVSLSGHKVSDEEEGARDQINVSVIANTPASPVIEQGGAIETPAPAGTVSPEPEPSQPQPSEVGQTPPASGGAEALTPPESGIDEGAGGVTDVSGTVPVSAGSDTEGAIEPDPELKGEELHNRAAELDIEGRSEMNADQLREAVAKAEAEQAS